MDLGIFLLRIVVGLTLAAHGAQKLFGWFGGPGLDKAGQGMAMLGFQPGRRSAFRAGIVETAGGALLALGLFTPLAGTLVASVMLVAAVSAHLKKGFFLESGGFEYTLVLGAAGISVALTGPGALSIDALLGISVNGAVWGLGAVVAAAAGGAIQLSQRRYPSPPQVAAAA